MEITSENVGYYIIIITIVLAIVAMVFKTVPKPSKSYIMYGEPVASNSYAVRPKLLIPDTYKIGALVDDHAERYLTNNLKGPEKVYYEIWNGWNWCGDNRNYPTCKFQFDSEAEAMEIAQLTKTNPKLISPMITDEYAEELKLKTYTIQKVERSNIISI